MKSTHHFRDQVSVISGWFDQWNDCEQTVALYSLIKKLGPTQARFLALVLDQNITQCMELSIQEQEANDPAYINSLSTESKETAVTQLLSHLPLLRPGNEDAKAQYLSLIPKILAHSIAHSVHIEESRQLLSYSLIHPAISSEDRRSLTLWLRQLEDQIHNYALYPVAPSITSLSVGNGVIPTTTNGVIQSPPIIDGFGPGCQYGSMGQRMDAWRPGPLMGLNGNPPVEMNGYSMLNGLGSNSLPPGIGSQHVTLHTINSAPPGGIASLSSHPDGTRTLPLAHSRVKRSNSLTPPGNTPGHSSRPPSTPLDWAVENDVPVLNSASMNQRTEHAPLSPQSSVASSGSGSESQKEEKDMFSIEGSGMKDVPMWLKGLRLHKYSYVFKNMTYEEMMDITEEKLEKMNITKGARHKIVLSIQKLKERQSVLQNLEKDLQDGVGTIRAALNEMKSMLQTPIKSFTSSSGQEKCQDSTPCETSDSSGSRSSPQSPSGTDGDASAQVAEGDIPGQITRLLGKICSSLLITPKQEDENLNFFVMLLDKCLGHEVFTPQQKRRLFSWKQQVQKICHPLPPRRSLDSRQSRKWNTFNGTANGATQSAEFSNSSPGGSVTLRRRMPVQFQQPPQHMALAQQGISGNFTHTQPGHRSPLSAVIKRPSLQDHMKPHVQIQRTHSAPVRPNPLPSSVFGKSDASTDGVNDPEINNRLESLCLSVTEHAIGSFDGAVPLF